ncbi:MAG: tRNA (adenosine(37)-N6)-dimethylallyltransferase MiaA [Candidatus Paceibacterota bacterium]|jgi:tRNA dimethylallyltransferase
MKTKIVVIVGPTAVGKSDFAVKYALENDGEIISADSRQVYKNLDIGTGKITVEEMRGIPHHLLSIVDANEIFNVDKFCIYAKKAIENISSRGKLPIICGGTGFYIDSLANNTIYPDVKHNTELRDELKNKTPAELINILNDLDTEYVHNLNNSEKNNKQRLIRSIEIAKELGKVPGILKNDAQYDIKWIGLQLPFPELKERIHARLIKRIDGGMLEEAERLHINGLSYERMEDLGLEYRYLSRYLQYSITKDEMIEQLESEICKYAKRQMVWFKRNKEIEWINVKEIVA